MWKKAKEKWKEMPAVAELTCVFLKRALESSQKNDSILKKCHGQRKCTPAKNWKHMLPSTTEAQKAKAGMLYIFKAFNMMETSNTEFLEGFAGLS